MNHNDPAQVFRVEAQELLEQIERGLLDLEINPGDQDLVAQVFRALHTLKGSGAMFGFDALADFAHHYETAFDSVRKGKCAATPELIGVVLAAFDHLRALAEEREVSSEQGEALIAAVTKAVANSKGEERTESAIHHWHVRFRLPPGALVNGTRPLSLLDELRALGDCEVKALTDDIPELSALDPTQCHIGWDVHLRTPQPRTVIEDVFMFVIDDMSLEIEDLGVGITSTDDIAQDAPVLPSEVAPVAGELADGGAPVIADGRQSPSGDTIRVPAGRLDELMDRVGELVIAQSRLKEISGTIADTTLRAVSEEIERLASALRDTMMSVRTVPISQLFGRFRRLIHDLSRDLGKTIEFRVEGETTELDKTVIERLADPLIHLIRNAIDHGLETPEQRQAAGKSAAGQVVLSAHQAGTEVVITIADDGRGVNRAKVRAKAEENGLIAPGAVLSDAELLQVIFQPGFSTAGSITSISGRGVGMDVVKRAVEGLRGAIEISSIEGNGSQVELRIPLTLAIIDGLLIRVGTGRYIIPLSTVEECVFLTAEQDNRSANRNFLSLRDKLVPFLRLRSLFATGIEPDLYQKVVVVSTGSERVGLIVDQIQGYHQTVIKPLSRLHANVKAFSGATILSDGSVALILDVPHLVAIGAQQEERLKAAS